MVFLRGIRGTIVHKEDEDGIKLEKASCLISSGTAAAFVSRRRFSSLSTLLACESRQKSALLVLSFYCSPNQIILCLSVDSRLLHYTLNGESFTHPSPLIFIFASKLGLA